MTIAPDQLVTREVHYCVSSLVATLANGSAGMRYGDSIDGTTLSNLVEQAASLCAPIEDWEEAAREAGWSPAGFEPVFLDDYEPGTPIWVRACNADDGEYTSTGLFEALSAQHACDNDEIDPYQREVYEHWIVSDWLAEQLEAKGEKVDHDFAGLTVWARTTTGQGIASDSVIIEICDELNAA